MGGRRVEHLHFCDVHVQRLVLQKVLQKMERGKGEEGASNFKFGIVTV